MILMNQHQQHPVYSEHRVSFHQFSLEIWANVYTLYTYKHPTFNKDTHDNEYSFSKNYLDAVQPVAIMSAPYLSNFPELVVNVCFSALIAVTGSS